MVKLIDDKKLDYCIECGTHSVKNKVCLNCGDKIVEVC